MLFFFFNYPTPDDYSTYSEYCTEMKKNKLKPISRLRFWLIKKGIL